MVSVMGILNVTPDSFSDAGEYFASPEDAILRALEMEAQGAGIIDVGAESTGPGFSSVPFDEEWTRLEPVLRELKKRLHALISVDTRHVETAKLALRMGVDIINDVGIGRDAEAMYGVVAEYKRSTSGICYVLTHSEDIVKSSVDPVVAVETFWEKELRKCQKVGLNPEHVALDPGIGFGKTLEQNFALIRGLNCLVKRESPVLLGASRKSFMRVLPHGNTENARDRLGGSVEVACYAAERGVRILRVHDVAETVQALAMLERLNSGENFLRRQQ